MATLTTSCDVQPVNGGGGGDTTPPFIPSGQSFTVQDTVSNSDFVGTVIATDNVGVVFMDITAGNTNGAFSMLANGEFYVNSATAVVNNAPFTLTVIAQDAAGNTGTSTVTVNVTAAPDTEDPVVTPGQSFSVAEDAPNGTVVGTVLATDNVGVTGFSITNGNTGTAFAIANNGQLTVANTTALVAGGYTLTITVTDAAGNTGFNTVSVTATAAGDTTPPNIPSGQVLTVDANAPDSSFVGTIVATDNFGVTFMDITNGNTVSGFPFGAFYLANDGNLYVNSQAAVAGNGGDFTLTVIAQDAAGNTATETVAVAVTTATPQYPSVVSSTTVETTIANTSHTFTLPTTADGDRLLAILGFGNNSVTPGAALSTWTGVASHDIFSNLVWRVYDLQCDGTEGGTQITFTTAASCKAAGKIVRVSGAALGSSALAVSGTSGTQFSLNPDPPPVTAPWGADLNLFIGAYLAGNSGATLLSAPTDYASGGATPASNQLTVGVASRQLQVATTDPGSFTIDDGTAGENWQTLSFVYQPAVGNGNTGGGGGGDPEIPAFNTGSAITINPGDNAAAVVAAQPAGTHFALVAGTYNNWSDVRPKDDMHFRGAGPSTILNGTGKNYAFRAFDNATDNVVIGNMKIQNYGNGTSRQDYGAIQAKPTDTIGGQFTYGQGDNWFIYDVEMERNASNGIFLSDNCTVYRCDIYGHTVTGIHGDRFVGGLIHSTTLSANALNPATGAGSNGANIKVTWVNADTGRTSIVPVNKPKAPFTVKNCVFNATKSGIVGTSRIGMWFDLDCQDTLVEDCTFNDHIATSIFWEGCNNGTARNNTVNNSDGYGGAFNDDFSNAAICFGESTNCLAEGNTLNGCTWAMMNRLSNRTSDWYNSNNSSFVNYAWPSGPRYWILHLNNLPTVTGQSNMWTGANTFRNNTLINCGNVCINEGTNANGQIVQGATPDPGEVGELTFEGNDYSQSPGIVFYNKSNTSIGLSAWQALGYDVPVVAANEFITAGADIKAPDGSTFYGSGMNVAFNLIQGPFVFQGFQGGTGPCVGAFDTPAAVLAGCLYMGGGTNSAGSTNSKGTTIQVFDPPTGSLTNLPHRYNELKNNWKQSVIRVNLLSKGSPTPPVASDIISAALPSIQEAVDFGMVVIPDCHDLTGGNVVPTAAWNAPRSSFTGDFGSVVEVQDAIITNFLTDGSGTAPGTANVKSGHVWFNPTNEPWANTLDGAGNPPQAYFDQMTFWLQRIRNYHGAENIVVLNLCEYSQNLNGLATGKYDAWWNQMKTHASGDLTRNVVLAWHAYGARSISTGYTYATMDSDLAAVRAKGFPLIVGEYGQAPVGMSGNAGPDQWNRNAVEYLVTNTHGQPLADRYNICPIAWHGTGDSSFSHLYRLTKGATATDLLSVPVWKITSGTDVRLEPFGAAHWSISHTLDAKN